jgi:FixJ family two-component response regulator
MVPADEHEHEHEHEPNEEKLGVATIFVVDDDPSIRRSMERLIGSTGYAVETFASVQEFLKREYYDGYGCVVADLHMPGGTGLDLQTQLNKRNYTMPIIFITGAGDTASGVQAMKLGAVDFLAKPVDNEKLIRIITDAVETDFQARAQYAQLESAKKQITRLTLREREVLELVVKGLLNKQIAHRLGISIKTVKAHRGHIMHKVEANSVTDLVRLSEIAVEAPISS